MTATALLGPVESPLLTRPAPVFSFDGDHDIVERHDRQLRRRQSRINLHRLDLVTLSVFLQVAHSGSISKGAQLAHLTIGAVSKRLSDLESSIGTLLFDRHSRGVTLTDVGSALQRHAKRILSDVELMSSDLINRLASDASEVVKVLANSSDLIEFLPGAVAEFTQAHATTQVDLSEQASPEIVAAVSNGRAELGIFTDGTPALGLQTVPCRSERLVLVIGRSNRLAGIKQVAFEEVADSDFVGLSETSSLGRAMQAAAAIVGRPLRVRTRANGFDAVCALVAAGLGIAVVPEAAARLYQSCFPIDRVDLQDSWAVRTSLLGARDFRTLSKSAKAFARHIAGAAFPTD